MVMLLISIALLLQVTAVQKLGNRQGQPNFLNEGSEFHAEIGHIKLNWWDATRAS